MKKIYVIGFVLFSAIHTAFCQEGFLGEIRLMSTNFAPKGWAICQGQTLPINQNQALFSLLGTTYGGNGTTNFLLPDLRGRVVVGVGPTMALGEKSGAETVTLNASNIPAHSHFEHVMLSTTAANTSTATPTTVFAAPVMIVNNAPKTALAYTTVAPTATLAGGTTTTTNGGVQSPQAITNIQPYLALTYMICLQGIYPSQN